MIKSIRIKVFLILAVFLAFFVGVSFFMNTKYLEKYYLNKNKSIFIFFFSKWIIKPIVDLSSIAKGISNYDFSRKCDVKSKDEIKAKQERDEMRRIFISTVSHELKSPIGITKSYAEGLKYNIANNEEKRKRYCDILIDEAEKMDQMVKQLLNLSNLESEEFRLKKSVFNLSHLMGEVVENFNHIIKEKDIKVKVIIDEDYLVDADYLRIEQVITNYLTNAINHVDKGKYIEVRAQSVGKKVRVSVINSGKNIPEEDLRNIWKNFYKVDKARTREHGGIGLGLSIVKSIMEHHGEEYGIINKKFGVEFWFQLKIIKEE